MIDSESGDLSAMRDEVLKEAVESTRGLIAVNGDKAVDIFFTRCCGGA
jgi:hypothetical protein